MAATATQGTAAAPRPAGTRRPRGKRLRTAGFHVTASALSLLWFLPIALILVISFRSTDDVLGHGLNALPRSFAPGNYASAWTGGGMQQALINSAIVSVPAVALTLLLASMAAFALSRYRIPLRRTLILLMLGGNLLPPQILLVPVAKLSQVFGLYDSLGTLVAVEVGFGLGFYVFVLQGFMRTIPVEIQQAALLDGAGPFQVYWRIVLPLTRPALAALGALSFTWVFNDLLWPITVLITQSKMPVTPALLGLQGQFVSYWNVIAAGSVIAAIPTVAVFLRFQRHFIAGLNLGSGEVTVTEPNTRPGVRRWTLRTASTSYTVEVPGHGRWAELSSWGPIGVEDGPSPLAGHGRTPFRTAADAAPAEYLPFGLRPFGGADLDVRRPGGERGSWWSFAGERDGAPGELRLAFTDTVLGLEAVLCYRTVPGTDVIRRWTELANTGAGDLLLARLDSAAVNVAVPGGARLTYLAGQWAQEFQLGQVRIDRGGFGIGSTQGVSGHDYAPWLAVQDAALPDGPATPTWGVSLAWSGSWHIDAQVDAGRLLRLRAGREPHEGEVLLPAGGTLATPELLVAFSPDGLGGLARVWHAHERLEAGPRGLRPRPVLYNSWEATGFDVEQDGQLELARLAASIGAELFVVDDGWFTGRADDTAGLGDWEPDPAAFPDGFGTFVDEVRGLGLDFGLWVEPESVSPGSRLHTEHPEWVYAIEGRPATLIRGQLALDLGRDDVREYLLAMLDRLLRDYPISYLKWDMNRPPTERGRPGDPLPRAVDLDAAHVANYHRILSTLRSEHPHVLVEGCAGGGGRADAAAIAHTDVVWPSDNTGPQDRLAIQYGFLHAHAPGVMSSWVTDAAGYFDTRPRSLRFRFVTAMAGALGIGADLRGWTPEQRTQAAAWIADYKRWRETLHRGEMHLIGSPEDATCGVQYSAPDGSHELVLAWNSGALSGLPLLPGRPDRLRLRGLDPAARYLDESTGTQYSGAHLQHAGLPCPWSGEYDADAVVLRRC